MWNIMDCVGCYVCRFSCEAKLLVIAVARLICTQAAVVPFSA